jgi:nucleotide-binding universal stress UspA family protein
MSFTRTLCPIDLSPLSVPLLARAIDATDPAHGHIVVLHAVEPLLLQAATIAGDERALRAEIDEALQRVIAAARRRTAQGPVIETAVVEVAPETGILETSQRVACDLIVMGTHGMSGLGKPGFGSTLDRVLRATTVPVLAWPLRFSAADDERAPAGVAHVIAAIDFAQPSMEAARLAAGVASRHGADLTLLHVMPAAPAWDRWRTAVAEQHALRRERAENELAMLASELGPRGPLPRVVVREGSAWEEIAAAGGERPGTLVVMGLRNPGRPLARPGSTAWRVLSAGAHAVLAAPADTRRQRPLRRHSPARVAAYTETA